MKRTRPCRSRPTRTTRRQSLKSRLQTTSPAPTRPAKFLRATPAGPRQSPTRPWSSTTAPSSTTSPAPPQKRSTTSPAHTASVESTSDTFTNSETDTNQTLTSSEVETGLTNETDTEAGNNIAGTPPRAPPTARRTTRSNRVRQQPGSFILTSTLVTVAISSAVSATNEITGRHASSSTHETSTFHAVRGLKPTRPAVGQARVGATAATTPATAKPSVTLETGSGLSDSIDVGNSITGSDSQSESSSETTTTVQTNVVALPLPRPRGDGQGGGATTAPTVFSTDSLSDGGKVDPDHDRHHFHLPHPNRQTLVTGSYSLTEIDASSTTLNQSGITTSFPSPHGERARVRGTATIRPTRRAPSPPPRNHHRLQHPHRVRQFPHRPSAPRPPRRPSSDTLTKTDSYVGQISQPAGEVRL